MKKDLESSINSSAPFLELSGFNPAISSLQKKYVGSIAGHVNNCGLASIFQSPPQEFMEPIASQVSFMERVHTNTETPVHTCTFEAQIPPTTVQMFHSLLSRSCQKPVLL